MNKSEYTNNVIVSMAEWLDKKQIERLRNVLVVNFTGRELAEMETLPSTIVFDNDYILERFAIDMLAKGIKKSTIEQYLRMVKKFLKMINKNYREVSGQDITDFIAIYQYRYGISNTYKSVILKYLSSFFKWAYRKRHIDEDIMRDVDSIRPEQKKKVRLSNMQIEDIREAAQALREKAILELMLATGCRVSELSLLNITDIDFANKRINIYGEKTSTYRTGFLSVKAEKAIKQYLLSRNDSCEALFVTQKGSSRRLRKESIQGIAKALGERAKVSFTTTVHIYRKTFASIQYSKTKDILYVSKLLGHASTDVTVKYYLCDDIDDMQIKYNRAS